MTELVKITGKIVRSGEEPINVEVIASAPINRDAYDFDKDVNVPQELKNAVLNNSDFRKVGRIRSCVGLGDMHLTCYYVSGVTDTGVPGVTFALFNSNDNTVQTERLTQDLNIEYIYSMIDSKGFRDEERKVITIPGSSVKYPTELAGHLVQVGQNGMLEDGGDKGQFAPAGHSHSAIFDKSTESNISIDEGVINIVIEGEGSGGETELNANNIGNLHRALATPSSMPENNAAKLITSKAVYDALLGKMGVLKEIFINCDDSGSADAWEIRPDAISEAAFRAALVWGNKAPRLVIVNIMKGAFGTTNHKTYRTIGSIHATAVEVNTDSYDLTAEIYVDGHVFTRTGQEDQQEQTWGLGLTLASNDIFTHTSNL